MQGIFNKALVLTLVLSMCSTSAQLISTDVATTVVKPVITGAKDALTSLANTTPTQMVQTARETVQALVKGFDTKATDILKWAADHKMDAVRNATAGLVIGAYVALAGSAIHHIYKQYQRRKASKEAYVQAAVDAYQAQGYYPAYY